MIKEPSIMTVQDAGSLDGLALLQRLGKQHFAAIGKNGQKEMRNRLPNMAKEWGKMGGRPRKMPLLQNGGERRNE